MQALNRDRATNGTVLMEDEDFLKALGFKNTDIFRFNNTIDIPFFKGILSYVVQNSDEMLDIDALDDVILHEYQPLATMKTRYYPNRGDYR